MYDFLCQCLRVCGVRQPIRELSLDIAQVFFICHLCSVFIVFSSGFFSVPTSHQFALFHNQDKLIIKVKLKHILKQQQQQHQRFQRGMAHTACHMIVSYKVDPNEHFIPIDVSTANYRHYFACMRVERQTCGGKIWIAMSISWFWILSTVHTTPAERTIKTKSNNH